MNLKKRQYLALLLLKRVPAEANWYCFKRIKHQTPINTQNFTDFINISYIYSASHLSCKTLSGKNPLK